MVAIVNQWPVTAQNDYGHQVATVANSNGNALIGILGLGSNSQTILPRFNVADDAHNFWQFSGTSLSKTATRNRRADVFVAPNASLASLVSVCESWFTNGVAGVILEVSGFPTYAQVDFVAVSGGFGTSAVAAGTATTSDVLIGALLLSDVGGSLAVTPPAGLTA